MNFQSDCMQLIVFFYKVYTYTTQSKIMKKKKHLFFRANNLDPR